MDKRAKNLFSFNLPNIRKTSSFYFYANEFESSKYSIEVIGKSVFKKLSANIIFPKYLGIEEKYIQNIGDLIIPEGTIIKWHVLTENTSSVDLIISNDRKHFKTSGFNFNKQFFNTTDVLFMLNNSIDSIVDSTFINVSVIKDNYPSISVEPKQDSVSTNLYFFSGYVSDDYGLDKLSFVYKVYSDSSSKQFSFTIQSVSGTSSSFLFSFDFLKANLNLEDKVEYYFTITDNDAIHKGKTTKSLLYTYELPNLDILNEKRDDALSNAKSSLSSLMDKSIQFKEKVNRLKKDILKNNSSGYNKIQQVKELKQTQNDLKEALESIQNDLKESSKEMESLSKMEDSISDKQNLIDDLLNEVMDDELLDLLNKLEDLIKKNDNPNLQKESVDDIESSSNDINKQLDRSIEMLKKLQVNEKIDAIEKELYQLSIDQNKLID